MTLARFAVVFAVVAVVWTVLTWRLWRRWVREANADADQRAADKAADEQVVRNAAAAARAADDLARRQVAVLMDPARADYAAARLARQIDAFGAWGELPPRDDDVADWCPPHGIPRPDGAT